MLSADSGPFNMNSRGVCVQTLGRGFMTIISKKDRKLIGILDENHAILH